MKDNSQNLLEKVALVTGGSRGIGAAIARRLGADGAAVSITYVNRREKAEAVVDAIKKKGGKAIAIRADSADAEEVRSAVAETVRAFGRIDVLVNNAGIAIFKPYDEFSL